MRRTTSQQIDKGHGILFATRPSAGGFSHARTAGPAAGGKLE